MVNIEPYDFQKKTNIKEHNDIVTKINEIVDVINNNNLDTITPRISKLETDVSTIKATDSLQWTDIENLKTKNTEYDNHFSLNDSEIDGITKSLISDVALMNGTTTGNVKVRIGRKDTPSIDSNDYNLQKPTSVELIQGSAPAMVKAQITLSDGAVLISDDFMFTTEAIGQDVYISSFVFKNGNVAGTISADIGLSNGSTLTANNFAVPTDPNVTSAISDLQTRMTAVEGGSVGGLDELKATVDSHTASISALDSDVANLQIDKADISTVETLTNTVNGKVNIAQGTGNAGKVLGINASGNVEPILVSGGEVWEEVDLSNIPTNWTLNERIKVFFCCYPLGGEGSKAAIDYVTGRATAFSEFMLNNITDVNVFQSISKRYNGCELSIIACGLDGWNSTTGNLFCCFAVNDIYGINTVTDRIYVTRNNINNYVYKMYRLKK